jgi:hypothetical protein
MIGIGDQPWAVLSLAVMDMAVSRSRQEAITWAT